MKKSVLVTRPNPDAKSLCEFLSNSGFDPVHYPVINIKPIDDPSIKSKVLNIDYYDVIIVISPSAARLIADWIDQYWPQMPVGQFWVAVGTKTQEILQNADIAAQVPDRKDTQGILKLLSALNLSDKRVLIIRGKGGLEHLKQSLETVAAKVEYLELYERIPLNDTTGNLRSIFESSDVQFVVASSGEILHHWVEMMRSQQLNFDKLNVLVPSQRVADQAEEQGIQHVFNCSGADNKSIVNMLNRMIKDGNKL